MCEALEREYVFYCSFHVPGTTYLPCLFWATEGHYSYDISIEQVPSICEVMAGEFHDQQARRNTGGGGARALRRTRRRTATSAPFTSRAKTKPSKETGELGAAGETEVAITQEDSAGVGGTATATSPRIRNEDSRTIESVGDVGVLGSTEGIRSRGSGGGGKSRRLPVAEEGENEEDWSAEPAAAASSTLLPIHQLMRSLGPRGYRRRG